MNGSLKCKAVSPPQLFHRLRFGPYWDALRRNRHILARLAALPIRKLDADTNKQSIFPLTESKYGSVVACTLTVACERQLRASSHCLRVQ